MPEESLMLTGDQNIIDVQFVVFWHIADAGKYLFNIREPEATVHNVAEAAMREVIGQTAFEFASTEKGRLEIQTHVLALMRRILNDYGSGIMTDRVQLQLINPPAATIEAFRDVVAAGNDKGRMVEEAKAYFSEVTQRAEGQAQQIIKGAEAYKEQTIAIASGDAKRFLSVYEQYALNKELTTRRIYLETMEDILGGIDKVLIDSGDGGALPFLSVNELLRQHQGRPAAGTTGAPSQPSTGGTAP
jgi:membrane protease subunit HflK